MRPLTGVRPAPAPSPSFWTVDWTCRPSPWPTLTVSGGGPAGHHGTQCKGFCAPRHHFLPLNETGGGAGMSSFPSIIRDTVDMLWEGIKAFKWGPRNPHFPYFSPGVVSVRIQRFDHPRKHGSRCQKDQETWGIRFPPPNSPKGESPDATIYKFSQCDTSSRALPSFCTFSTFHFFTQIQWRGVGSLRQIQGIIHQCIPVPSTAIAHPP